MIENFKHRYSDSFEDTLNIGQLISEGNLTNEETLFLKRVKEAWNFYEGYHWEGIDDLDTPQVTFNYCRPFVNKFVSFEFGKGFSIKTPIAIENIGVTVNDPKIETDLDTDRNGFVDINALKNILIRVNEECEEDDCECKKRKLEQQLLQEQNIVNK